MTFQARWWRVAAVCAAGAVLALAPSGMAAAADAVKATVSGGQAFVNLPNTKGPTEPVGYISLAFFEDQDPSLAYCIDVNRNLVNGEYTESTWANSGRNAVALAKIQWLLTNSFPQVSAATLLQKAGVEGLSGEEANKVAYAGTQAAIWSFSDPDHFALRGAGEGRDPSPIEQVYNYLRANAGTGTEPAPSLSIEPATKTGPLGQKLGPYTVRGAAAVLTVTGGSAVDANGTAVTQVAKDGTFYLTATAVGTVSVTATGNAQVKAGRVFTRTNAQSVILATPATARLTANAAGSFTVAPSLPVTGAPVLGAIAAGVVLLGAGGVLLLTARRRRIRFTE